MNMSNIIIDDELKKYMRPLRDEEYEKLKESVLTEGIRDPLVTWRGILLDGYHRYKLAQEHNLEYKTVEVDLPNKEAAKEWIITNQLGRRNLTPQEASYYRGKLYEARKLSHGGDRKSKYQNETLKTTAEEIGKEYGVSRPTVFRDADFSQAVDKVAEEIGEEAKHAILTGKVNIPKQEVKTLVEIKQKAPDYIEPILRGDMDLKQAKKRIKTESAKKQFIEQTKTTKLKAVVEISDAIEWLNKMPQCDLLLTDPPYMTDVDDINSFANWLITGLNKVKDTGRAYVFIGAYPEELKAYLNVNIPEHIKLCQILIWTYKNTLGNNPKDRYKQNYQACLYFKGVNAPYLNCPITNEQWAVQEINAPDGRLGDRLHAWQKPLEIADRFIRHSTAEGDIVYDPFAGTGTFLLAAAKLGRIAKGCDISEDNLKIAIERGCEYA